MSPRTAALGLALLLAGTACQDSGTEPNTAIPVASVAIGPDAVTLPVGQSAQLAATPKASDGAPLLGRAVTWESDRTDIATVNAQGLVTTLAAGAAVITATSEGKKGTAQVTVTVTPPPPPPPPAVASVELDVAQLGLLEGETQKLVATPKDAAGQPLAGRGHIWSSSDASVAMVQADGTVIGLRAGQVTIKVTVEGKTAQATATITADYAYDLIYDAASDGITTGGPRRLDIRQASGVPAGVLPAGVSGGDAVASPDGSRIAFTGVVNGWPGIHVMNADGSNILRLTTTTDDNPDLEPAWSPDGQWISFTRWSVGSGKDIWVVGANGAVQEFNLTDDMGGFQQSSATWSPAAVGRIAYVDQGNGSYRIWTMNADGSDKKPVTTGGDLQPAWSPDGTTIAFQRSGAATFGDIWLVNANGGNERSLLPVALAGPQWAPAWSPDGKLVAFGSSHETYGSGSGVDQIYTVWADGTKLARRTSGTMAAANPGWIAR